MAIGNQRAPTAFSRITTEGTGDTEGEGGRGFGVPGRYRVRSRARGSPGGEPRRIGGNGKEGECRPAENFLSPPLCALGGLCGGPSFRLTTEGSGDTRGRERKTRFRTSGNSGVRARDLGRGKQGGRRTADGLLSPPSVPSVSSVVKQEREGGGRIGGPGPADFRGDRESAGSHGVFPDHHRGHRGHRGGEGGRGFVFPGRPPARSRKQGRRGGHHGGPRGTKTREKNNRRTVSSPSPLCSLCPLW